MQLIYNISHSACCTGSQTPNSPDSGGSESDFDHSIMNGQYGIKTGKDFDLFSRDAPIFPFYV